MKIKRNRQHLQAGLLLFLLFCVAASHNIDAHSPKTEQTVPKQIQTEKEAWGNLHESRIAYENGSYYYASQADHYYLYRANENGGNPQRLAKVHPDGICVQEDTVYFTNQSDNNSIYRIKTDGSGMEKLLEEGYGLQADGGYLFFCAPYDLAYDTYKLVSVEERAELSESDTGFLYRMKPDGSERKLLARHIHSFAALDGSLYYSTLHRNETEEGYELRINQMDFNVQGREELCRFTNGGRIIFCHDAIYCIDKSPEDHNDVTWFSLQNKTLRSFSVSKYTDACIWHGYFYSIHEQPATAPSTTRTLTICKYDLSGQKEELVYSNVFQCRNIDGGSVSDLYAAEEGVFFRQFVSETEGCHWFRLSEDGAVQAWEDRAVIPNTLPARQIDSGEHISVNSVLESTEGYETYLADDLSYEEYFHVSFQDPSSNANCSWEIPFKIRLPQFNSKIAGYRRINAYFQNAYQEAMRDKDDYFKKISEEDLPTTTTIMWHKGTDYSYIYIGEKYITVDQRWYGYYGGVRGWYEECPVTFDLATGETVSLEALLGMPAQEAVAALTASVYKYKEGMGNGGLYQDSFFLQRNDILTAEYNPEKFFLFPDGIGIYYEKYAIDCGAAGDQLFVVPYEEFPNAF